MTNGRMEREPAVVVNHLPCTLTRLWSAFPDNVSMYGCLSLYVCLRLSLFLRLPVSVCQFLCSCRSMRSEFQAIVSLFVCLSLCCCLFPTMHASVVVISCQGLADSLALCLHVSLCSLCLLLSICRASFCLNVSLSTYLPPSVSPSHPPSFCLSLPLSLAFSVCSHVSVSRHLMMNTKEWLTLPIGLCISDSLSACAFVYPSRPLCLSLLVSDCLSLSQGLYVFLSP